MNLQPLNYKSSALTSELMVQVYQRSLLVDIDLFQLGHIDLMFIFIPGKFMWITPYLKKHIWNDPLLPVMHDSHSKPIGVLEIDMMPSKHTTDIQKFAKHEQYIYLGKQIHVKIVTT